MKVEIKGTDLVITLPMQSPPKPSSSGKTLIVATSAGNKTLDDVLVDGKPVTVGVNAYIKRP
jgi:hypothetical protein